MTDAQKQERVRCSQVFDRHFQREGERFLQNIVTMDESAVSYHTPETKQQSKQWLKKGTPGPIKARSQASRIKQMVLAFFDMEGMIYTHMVPRGKTVNGEYVKEVQTRAEETGEGKERLHLPLGQCPRPHGQNHQGLSGDQECGVAQAPPLQPGPGSGRLFSVSQGQIGSGGRVLGPGELQGQVGWGHPGHQQGGVCQGLPEVGGEAPEVYKIGGGLC